MRQERQQEARLAGDEVQFRVGVDASKSRQTRTEFDTNRLVLAADSPAPSKMHGERATPAITGAKLRSSRRLVIGSGVSISIAIGVAMLGNVTRSRDDESTSRSNEPRAFDAPVRTDTPAASDPDMVNFPAATFEMGSTPDEIQAAYAGCMDRGCPRKLFEREGPIRTVRLSPFALDRTEVTNEAFARWLSTAGEVAVDRHLVRANGVTLIGLEASELQRVEAGFAARSGSERHPVAGVSAGGARAYCMALGKRLPTEAEWEYAARGTVRRRFPWGNTPDPAQLGCALRIGKVRDARCPDPRSVIDVASTPADVTPEGIHDLGGNVSEWVADLFAAPYRACGECRDPVVTDGTEQVIRGGNHVLDASVIRAATRSRSSASDAALHVGFRCAR